jgi:sulfoxide reductase heme-binding subunit YedZ
MQLTSPQISTLKSLLFLLALLPFGRLALAFYSNDLGPEPSEFVERWTGSWSLNFLLLTLCITPLRGILQWPWLGRLRRMLGLFTFFYATLHLLSFIGFDHAFAVDAIARDVLKKPFVALGFVAYLLMLPLALSSNSLAIRKLGGRAWQELHRNIYLIALLGILHYFWLSKLEQIFWPMAYAIVLGNLLAWRIKERRRRAIPVPEQASTAKPLRFFKKKPD